MSYLTAISFPHAFHRSERCSQYFMDFTTLGDGALPAPWIGPTFTISTAKAINTPGVGSNLLTDPGLEGAYGGVTVGLCDTLYGAGTATWTESADAHGGSKAQQALAGAFNANAYCFPPPTLDANSWYRFSVWGKRTTGTSIYARMGVYKTGLLPGVAMGVPILAADYTKYQVSAINLTAAGIYAYPYQEVGYADFSTVIVDDGVLEKLTAADLYAMFTSVGRLHTVKIRPSALADGTVTGVIAWANARSSPTSYLMAEIHKYSDGTYRSISLIQCVGGVHSNIVSLDADSEVADAWLEIRPTDSTHVGLYYNNAQIGSDVEVTDIPASGVNYAGFVISGGNNVEAFYAGTTIPVTVGWAGTSNTLSGTGYRVIANADILATMPKYKPTFLSVATSGWGTWPNLFRLASLASANIVIWDQSNDGSDDTPCVEAFIRRAWAQGNQVVSIVNPAWPGGTDMSDNAEVDTPINASLIADHLTICTAYGIPVVNTWALFQALVPGTYNLNDLMGDTAHLSATGMQIVATALRAYLPVFGVSQPATIPDRVVAGSDDFEYTPTVRYGTDYDGKTGTWAEDDTSISSSEAGATITFIGTFRSFGCYRADGTYPNVSVSIDGGDAINPFAFYVNGWDIGTRAAHTIIVTVLTTCKIDEFWAI